MRLHDWNKCRLMAHTTAHTLEKLARDKYDTTISVEYDCTQYNDGDNVMRGFAFKIRDCVGDYYCTMNTRRVVTIDELKTKRQLVGKVWTTHHYIVANDQEIRIDSDVYNSLEEGDKFVLK